MRKKINITAMGISIIFMIGVIAIMTFLSGFGASLFKKIDEEKCFAMKDINEIQVTMSSEHVHIIQNKASDEVKFHLYGKATKAIKLDCEINNNNKIVVVKCKDAGQIDLFLDIYIPEKYAKNLSINTSSGVVKMDSIDLAEFTLNTSSGGMEAEKLNAKKVFLTTSSGKLALKELVAPTLGIKGSTGSISIDECISQNARIETVSGSITLKNCNGNFDLKGKSVGILVSYKEFEKQNINIVTTTGSITLELPGTAEFVIKSQTDTGKIRTDFPIVVNEKGKLDGRIGTKNNKILLQTSSGNIKILKK